MFVDRKGVQQEEEGNDTNLQVSNGHATYGNSGTNVDKYSQEYGATHSHSSEQRTVQTSHLPKRHQDSDRVHTPRRETAQNTQSGGSSWWPSFGYRSKDAATTPDRYASSNLEALLTGKIERREEKIKQLNEERGQIIKSFQMQVDSLQKKIDRQEIELKTTKEDLLAIRKFAVVHNTRDAHSLIQSFKDLNTEVDDIAFNLSQFRSNLLPKTLLLEQLRQLHRQFGEDPEMGRFMQFMLEKRGSPQDFIFLFIRILLCLQLLTDIFGRFNPSIDKVGDDLLRTIHSRMLESEPQEKLGQWRAIAYTHSNPAEEVKESLLRQHSDIFVARAALMFDMFSPGTTSTREELANEYGASSLRLFRRAAGLHEEIRTKYLLCDYQVYSVDNQSPFVRDFMEAEGEHPEPDEVIFTVSLGLRSQKNILKDKKLTQEGSYIVKTVVIGNSWAPVT
ncbi:hypothetical protein CPB86DRAFT_71954 [Serendipita vermifera]|nr:hypothetical protein CPB86DRAFT_71954 [Serendipita vermifera]